MISEKGKEKILSAKKLIDKSEPFLRTIFEVLQEENILTENDIKDLCDNGFCAENFKLSSTYSILKELLPGEDLSISAKVNGHYRFYSKWTVKFFSKTYMVCHEHYGPKQVPNGSTDSKTPFYNWVLKKLQIEDQEMEQDNETIKETNEVEMNEIDMSNIIYYGVPGTGKTFRIQLDYINNPEKRQNTITTTFHQSFGYEEFVEGIKAKVNKQTNQIEYKVEKGIFYKACEKAAELAGFSSLEELLDSQEREEKIQKAIENGDVLYFCIDEINRGNIASIFGELISLIETSKRIGSGTATEMTVTLPYSGDLFGVPANLKIIGTMNTADRSIQLLDSALRRRFSFIECMPDYDVLTYPTSKSILKKINNRIRALLGKDYQIGHAYLINSGTDLDVFFCLRDRIIPLLEEYFYGETEKIRIVLNENDYSQNNYSFYVLDEEASSSISDIDDSIRTFKLNPDIFNVSTESDASKFISHI